MKVGSGSKKGSKGKTLKIKQLEKKIVPSPIASKKPPNPPPYPPGSRYGLVRRGNI